MFAPCGRDERLKFNDPDLVLLDDEAPAESDQWHRLSSHRVRRRNTKKALGQPVKRDAAVTLRRRGTKSPVTVTSIFSTRSHRRDDRGRRVDPTVGSGPFKRTKTHSANCGCAWERILTTSCADARVPATHQRCSASTRRGCGRGRSGHRSAETQWHVLLDLLGQCPWALANLLELGHEAVGDKASRPCCKSISRGSSEVSYQGRSHTARRN